MAKTFRVTFLVHLGNLLATSMVRLGLKVGPIQLLTVRGRTSGEPRTTPVAVVDLDGKRYLVAPYGAVNWVRNLRAAGKATLTLGRHAEAIQTLELAPEEAAPILKNTLGGGGSFTRDYFNVTKESSLQDFEREAVHHPVFLIQSVS
ncbi:MAG TPA: nitroreductase family deazaflavin-dependent oxidoreductase [Ktedonobacteraceae bacterium]|jgi:deazaflavin-dependent oxidoreductase (nitroreductase family)|nr:nitroreductase family deazaflavin-dependent oxidoreductase [Ktedonobacteraceae bacterium]